MKSQLRTLSKENAEGVAQHLVMVAELLDVEPEAALAHAETAVRRAGRVPAARGALGLVAYRLGDWARALGEFGATITFAGNFPGRTQTMPLAVYLALEQDLPSAIVLSLILLAVSVAFVSNQHYSAVPGGRGWKEIATGVAMAAVTAPVSGGKRVGFRG